MMQNHKQEWQTWVVLTVVCFKIKLDRELEGSATVFARSIE